ncbi:MAG: glycerol-3-phosphate dehydrogenase/oxidase [Vicinamibacteria bacterium]
MKRELSALEGSEFDVVVVGAGVYGAATAWDAALRGLSVTLIDKGDFGGATSFNSLKTVHGGLRYLQHGDFRRMRESVRERSTLMRIAPHLVHRLPFFLPTYRDGLRRRPILAVAMLLNDLVSFDRNRSAVPEKSLPPGKVVSRSESLRLVPGIREEGLTGGALWYDAQISNSDRLTLAFILSAAEAGAQVANFVEADGVLREGDRIRGIRCRDVLGGAELAIRGRVVINASGPWVDRTLATLGIEGQPRLFRASKAMNLVTRSVLREVAAGFSSRRHQVLFVIPWREFSLIGTTHAAYEGSPDDLEVKEEDVRELLEDINAAYPPAHLERDDVRLVHRGILPTTAANGERVTLVKKYRIHDHRAEGLSGLISLVGVKYTTARDVAEKAVDRVFDQWGQQTPPASRTASTPVQGGVMEGFSEFVSREVQRRPLGLDEKAVRHLVGTYGSAYPHVLRHADANPDLMLPVAEGSAVSGVEILHAVREEQAIDLASVVLRRTELGSAGHPGRACLERCAAIMGGELGWSESKREAEVANVEEIYRRRS